MMAKVYAPPQSIPQPDYTIVTQKSFEEYEKAIKEYLKKLKEWCKKRKPRGQLVGEIIRFPVADGHAEYMVASLSPLELIHIPLGDAWHFQWIGKINSKDVRQMIESEKALIKLFQEKKRER